MADAAEMAVDGGVADGGAVGDMAHAAAVDQPGVDCSTDPEVLRQFRPAARTTHTRNLWRWSTGSRVSPTTPFTTCAFVIALVRTRVVYTRGKRHCLTSLT